MSAIEQHHSSNTAYLSWLPAEKRAESVTGGPGPLTMVRSCGEACDDPASPYLAVQLLMAGEASLDCDFGRGRFTKHFRRGDFVIVPPDTDIKFEGPGTFQALSLAIPKALFTESFEELGVPQVEECDQLFRSAHNDRRISALIELLWQELNSQHENGDLFVDGLWQSVLAGILDLGGLTPSRSDERLGRHTLNDLREHVRSSLHRTIRINELAQLVGMSPSRFSQEFRQAASATPSQFVMRERIARAKELLLDSRSPITEIALATGFCDQSHLTRHFKRHMGGTPAAFRNSRAG